MKIANKKIIKSICAFILVISIVFALPISAFAGTLPPGGVTGTDEGSYGNDAKVSITDKLNVADGVDISNLRFQFKATLTSVYEHSSSSTAYNNIRTITKDLIHQGETVTNEAVVMNTTSFLPAASSYPHAGLYEYNVFEVDTGIQGVTYSSISYTMKVYVKNGSGGLYIWGVTVEDNDTNSKVDPTLTNSASGNGFKFINSYVPAPITTPPPITTDPPITTGPPIIGPTSPAITSNASLTISKKVRQNKLKKEKQFKYEINIKIPKTTTAGTIEADKSDSNKDLPLSFEPNKKYKFSFNLKNNEEINIYGLPPGTIYTLEEKGDKNYKATALVTENGGKPMKAVDGEYDKDYTVTISGSADRTRLLIGQGENNVAFTNIYFDVVKTGFLIDNLPMILLLLITVITLFFYFQSRKHERSRYLQ